MAIVYNVKIREALDLWDCLDTLEINNFTISVLTPYELDAKLSKFKFAVKGPRGQKIYADYDTRCTVTLKNYTKTIGTMVALQAKIVAAELLWNQRLHDAAWEAALRSKWETEQRDVDASLDETLQIDYEEDDEAP